MHPFSLDERAKRKLLGLNGPEVALPKWCSIALVSNPLTLLSILDYSASKTTQTATALSTTVPDQQIKPTHQTPKIPARAPISNSPGRARRLFDAGLFASAQTLVRAVRPASPPLPSTRPSVYPALESLGFCPESDVVRACAGGSGSKVFAGCGPRCLCAMRRLGRSVG